MFYVQRAPPVGGATVDGTEPDKGARQFEATVTQALETEPNLFANGNPLLLSSFTRKTVYYTSFYTVVHTSSTWYLICLNANPLFISGVERPKRAYTLLVFLRYVSSLLWRLGVAPASSARGECSYISVLLLY